MKKFVKMLTKTVDEFPKGNAFVMALSIDDGWFNYREVRKYDPYTSKI